MSHQADIIDLFAGITPGSPLRAVRDQRPQAREQAQRSFVALLEPADPGNVGLAERYAVAAFEADLHGFEPAVAFYRDLLADEAPELVDVVSAAADAARGIGPYGHYREPELAAEGVDGPIWTPDQRIVDALGVRLAAALAHTHLLVYRPRESSPADLRALVDAGWDPDDIVRLSQLVSFLTFQFRTAAGLRALATARLSTTNPTGEGDPR